MTFEAIMKDLKQGKFAPIYLLHGNEDFYIDKVSDYIEEHALSEAEKGFNQTVLYGADVNALQMMDVLRRYPMMAEKQVVILKEAQNVKAGNKYSLEDLMSYFEKPMPTTIFVIAHKHKNVAKNTKVYKALAKKAAVLESKKPYENQVPAIISDFAKAHGLSVDQRLAALLAEHLGTDLNKINNELSKLALNLPKGTAINDTHIEKYIGVSKDFNVFELNKALAMRNREKAFRIVKYFQANPKDNPFPLIIGGMYSFFSKAYAYHYFRGNDGEAMKVLKTYPAAMKDYKVFTKNFNLRQSERVVGILKEYDLKSKGLGDQTADKSQLYTDMAFKILSV